MTTVFNISDETQGSSVIVESLSQLTNIIEKFSPDLNISQSDFTTGDKDIGKTNLERYEDTDSYSA